MGKTPRSVLDRRKTALLRRLEGYEGLGHFYRSKMKGAITQDAVAQSLALPRETLARGLAGREIPNLRAEEIDLSLDLGEVDVARRKSIQKVEERLNNFCSQSLTMIGDYFETWKLDGDPKDLVMSYLDTFDHALDDIDDRGLIEKNIGRYTEVVCDRLTLMQLGMRTLFAGKKEFKSILHKPLAQHYVRFPFNILQVDPIKKYIKSREVGTSHSFALGEHLRDLVWSDVKKISLDKSASPALFDHGIQILSRFGWKSDAEMLSKSKLSKPNVMRSYLIGKSNELRSFKEAEQIIRDFERNADAREMIKIFEAVYFGGSRLCNGAYPSVSPIPPSALRSIAKRYHRVAETADSVVGLYKFMTVAEAVPASQMVHASEAVNGILRRLEGDRPPLTTFEKASVQRIKRWKKEATIR